jgi:hypothetical protein
MGLIPSLIDFGLVSSLGYLSPWTAYGHIVILLLEAKVVW